MINSTVGLINFPMSIKVLNFNDYPMRRGTSFMIVKVCTKYVDHSFDFFRFFLIYFDHHK